MAYNRRRAFLRNEAVFPTQEFHKPPRWFRYKKHKSPTKKARKPEAKKYDEFDDDDDYADDMNLGLPINTLTIRNSSNGVVEHRSKAVEDKILSDKEKILSFLHSTTKGLPNLAILKQIRFLFVSVQTFGNLDGICMPAEVALCEFNLKHGIIDKYHAIVEPYKLANEIQFFRAEYHSNATHKIPLNVSSLPTVKTCLPIDLLEQVLGRSEPKIACKQGVFVGLYDKNGLYEIDDDFAALNIHHSNRSRRPNQIKGTETIFAEDASTQRRWMVCLSRELELIQKSFSYLKQAENIRYDGFPTSDDRFVVAEALVEALAEFAGSAPNPEYKTWLESFGKTQPAEFETPWERYADVFCDFHVTQRNNCCACATATRSCFAIFYALCDAFSLSFGD